VHPQTAKYLELLAAWVPTDRIPTLEEMRTDWREPYKGERLELPSVTDLTAPGPAGEIPVRLYRPVSGDEPLPVLVYFHGGGWVIGSIDGVDAICRELTSGAGCAVLSAGYRLAPEDPFPAAVEDAWAVTADVVAHPERYGADPRTVAVAGDSAGGTLATVVAMRARDEGVRLAHQVLLYPPTDAAMDTPSWAAYGTDYGLGAEGMAWFWDLYVGGADRTDPRISPLRAADLSGLAPATILTAEYDILRDEAEAYATRLAEAGTPVKLTRYDGMVHSFFVLPEVFDDAITARRHVVERLRAAFDAARREAAA
jgi:acetyl esterase